MVAHSAAFRHVPLPKNRGSLSTAPLPIPSSAAAQAAGALLGAVLTVSVNRDYAPQLRGSCAKYGGKPPLKPRPCRGFGGGE